MRARIRRGARLLKEKLEKLNAFPFSGNIRIERSALDPGAVSGRGFRVKHLERVTAAHRARDHALHIFTIDWRRRRRFLLVAREEDCTRQADTGIAKPAADDRAAQNGREVVAQETPVDGQVPVEDEHRAPEVGHHGVLQRHVRDRETDRADRFCVKDL